MPSDTTIKWTRAICGAIAGLVGGVMMAPRMQLRLHRWFGVDVVSFGPGLAIISVVVVVCAGVGWVTAPRFRG